jgi:hypothetical protein
MKKVFILMLIIFLSSGCSVFMAAKQPDSKNLDVLVVGMPRNMVLGEFGVPTSSETKNGKKIDVISFTQGYSKGAKAGRAIFHGAADILTLGLWEAVGTPTESVFCGDKMVYEVTYNSDDKIEKVLQLSPSVQ